MNWSIIEKAGEGGQGEVSKVEFDDGRIGALKKLHGKNSSNKFNRYRFKNECKALEVLNINGVPNIYESNTDYWEDKEVELYFISEWIIGENLNQWRQKNKPRISESIKIVSCLLYILEQCHGAGILHRDIKPDNIMRSDDDEIYLVDFGIAKFEDNTSLKTAQQVELGNRFLRLPEYASGNHAFDETSDVTQVVGILFFLITGISPRILIDSDGKPPHRREDYDYGVSQKASRQLNRIFDIGFQHDKLRRFQSVKPLRELILLLITILEDPKAEENMDELDELRDFFTSKKLKESDENMALFKEISNSYKNVVSTKGREFGLVCGGSEGSHNPNKYALDFFILRRGTSDPKVVYRHYVELETDRIKLSVGSECFQDNVYFESIPSDKIGLIDAAKGRGEADFVLFAKRLKEKLYEIT